MNEWILAGVVVIGSLLAVGGGSWIVNALSHKKSTPKV